MSLTTKDDSVGEKQCNAGDIDDAQDVFAARQKKAEAGVRAALKGKPYQPSASLISWDHKAKLCLCELLYAVLVAVFWYSFCMLANVALYCVSAGSLFMCCVHAQKIFCE